MKRFQARLQYWLAAVTSLSFLLPDGRRLAQRHIEYSAVHTVQYTTCGVMQPQLWLVHVCILYVKCCVIQPTPKLKKKPCAYYRHAKNTDSLPPSSFYVPSRQGFFFSHHLRASYEVQVKHARRKCIVCASMASTLLLDNIYKKHVGSHTWHPPVVRYRIQGQHTPRM